MVYSEDEARWRYLESNAHRPEVQEYIRHAIKSGTIQVHPNSGGRIRIVPVRRFEPATNPTMSELPPDGTA
jgi:hypothetical protein